MQEGVSNVDEWQMDIDVNDLTENIHQLHLQVADKDGTWSTIHTHWFVKAPLTASHGMYWFDDNEKDMLRSDVLNGRFDIDVSKLTDGIHILNYQVRDTKDRPSAQYRTFFLKTPTPAKSKVHYWIDEDSEKLQTFAYNGNTHLLDIEGVSDGFHTLHIQAEDASPSSPMNKLFIKIPQTEGVEKLLCMCSIDGELARQEEVSNKDGVLNWTFDVSDIPLGFHNIMVQVITKNGAGSSVYNGYFLRDFSSAEIASLKCIYSIDGGEHKAMAGNLGGGVFHFDLDVADIKEGLHNITYMLMGDGGVGTKSNSAFFWKTPIGGNGVMQYNYWLNDQTEKHEVKLAKRTNPFDLITLLPVDKMPIRSSCFDFKIDNGSPIIYAKNDIHFEFIDASGFVNMANAQYVDMSESKKITGISTIESTQTFNRMAENEIKWFKFNAAPGDTIAFKASQATSLQVFAPSGKEIYVAAGDKSVKYGGAHTWEDGTYYVAVHDVTGSQQNITLDYMHMDKYDVVSQDVRVVGNGGCSTITFQGNGFKDLYAVDLKDSKGNVIQSIDVGHESDATTTVTFNFTGAKIGKYNAVFHFTEDDKTAANNITVEEAKDIELATKVSYPSTFLRGTTTTYTVEITNKGNMTAYQVPLMVGFRVPSVKDITDLKIDGVEKLGYIDAFNQYDFEDEDKKMINDILSQVDDISQFIIVKDSVAGMDLGYAHLLVTISPNSKKQILFKIQSTSSILFKAYSPGEWNSVKIENNSIFASKFLKASARSSLCCTKEKYQCALTTIADFLGIFGGSVNCGSQIISNTINTSFDIACSDGKTPYEKIGNYLSNNSSALAGKAINTTISCILGYYFPILKNLREEERIARMIGNTSEIARITDKIARTRATMNGMLASVFNISTTGVSEVNCFTLPLDETPDCPPNPGGGGGSSTPVAPVDPNDIYGYIAPSGTTFVGKDVVSMPYRIEFENDTTFATASAHTVVVKDTLDAKVFDLSSYQPTSIKIGEKDVQLKGDKEFVTTVDMRPAINAIAQVEGLYDEKKGIATWQFTSLDPMTMEPTDDIMQGFLPVNYDGSGIGEVAYNINRKAGLSDGVEIDNKASIVFDHNDAIATPVWTNIIDAIPPVSEVGSLEQMNDSIVRIHFDGYDNRSDIWKYSLYVQYGEGSTWNEVAEMDSAYYDFRFYEDIDYGFCVLATDSAGNVEQKIIQREYMFLNDKTEKIDAITAPVDKKRIAVTKAYDLSGRVVQEEGYRGIIIKNRKKIQKR